MMVDKACGFTDTDISKEWVRLLCPNCKCESRVRLEKDEPKECALIELKCPECIGSDWEQIAYFDNHGRELYPERH
jgi:hypothetical protein